MTENTLFMQMN